MQNWSYIIDGSIVIVYLISCLIFGFYKSKDIDNIKEYTLGKGRVSTFVLVCTFFATYVGAGVTMGTIEKVYTMGLIFIIAQLLIPISWFLNALVYAPKIEKFSKCITLGHIMMELYGNFGKNVVSIINLVGGIGVVAAQVLAMGFMTEYFFHIDKLYGVACGCIIFTLYSAFGGIRAVMLTDTMQFIIFYFGIPLGCFLALYDISNSMGGSDIIEIYSTLPDSYKSIDWTDSNIALLLGLAFYSLITINGAGHITVQRFLIAGTAQKLKRVLMIVGLVHIPFVVFLCGLGVIVKIKAPEIDSNQAFLYFIDTYMPIGCKGLIISGLLALMMSTADSWLNISSVIFSHEIFKPMFPHISAKGEVMVARIATLCISIIATVIALWAQNIMQLIWFIDNFWMPLLFVPVTAGFLGFRSNSKSFIASSILAMFFTLSGAYAVGQFATTSLLMGVMGSASGLFGMHYLQIVGSFSAEKQLIKDNKKIFFNEFACFIYNAVKKSFTENLPNPTLYIFGVFTALYCIIYYVMFSFVMNDLHPIEAIELRFRIALYFITFLLLFREIWSRGFSTTRLFKSIYNLLFILCLSFIPAYLVFLSNYSLHYVVSYVLTTLLLYLFTNYNKTIVFSVVGLVMALIIKSLLPIFGLNIIELSNKKSYLADYSCYFLTLVIFFFERQRYKKQQAKIADNILYSGSLAHEMRSPLGTIKMVNQMLYSILQNKEFKAEDADKMRKASRMIEEKCTKGLDSIDTILNIIRADFMSTAELKEYGIIEVAREAVKLCNLPDDLKVSINNKNAFNFLGSAELMVHVIMNLILNSIKHGKSTVMEIWCEVDDSGNSLHYRDNGKGIDDSIIGKIFDDFYTTDSKNGSGVGLAFCKKVIENIGGSIICVPNPHGGAYFVLNFPKV